jgi:hypothetical protein
VSSFAHETSIPVFTLQLLYVSQSNVLFTKVCRHCSLKITVFWDVTPRSLVDVTNVDLLPPPGQKSRSHLRGKALLALKMEAADSSVATSALYHATRPEFPEDSNLRIHCRENFKSRTLYLNS